VTSTTSFIAELVRATNESEKLSGFERGRLFAGAVNAIQRMRETINDPSAQKHADKIVELQLAVAEIGGKSTTPEELRATILTAASMIRDLHVMLDEERREGGEL
jgi:hypothetical protein